MRRLCELGALACVLAQPTLLATQAYGDEPSVIQVKGAVQFWERECTAAHRCGLPRALTVKLDVAGQMTRPSDPTVIGHFRHTLESAAATSEAKLVLKFDAYWSLGDGGARAKYLAGQVKLERRGEGEVALPLSECSFYDHAPQQVYFPVGACSGFLPAGDSYKQYGVTFYRDPGDVD